MVPGLIETYSELTKQSVFTVFFDATLDQFFFSTLGIVFGEDLVDLALAGKRLCRVNITTDKIFHDIAREFLVRLVPACQGLQDHTVAKVALNLPVERIGQHHGRGTSGMGETVASPSGLLLVYI